MSFSAKRHRATESEGERSPPRPAPGTITADFMVDVASSFPPERGEELACPFVKHNPEAYKHVRNACTLTGYTSVSTLKEHIKRVHLAKYGCSRCNRRFTCNSQELAVSKQRHKCDNTRKSRQESEVEVTTEEQDKTFLELKFKGSRGLTGEAAFKEIFRAFWPETSQEDVPDAYFKPGFVFSMPEIKAVLEGIEHRRRASAIPDPSPVETPASRSFITLEQHNPTPNFPLVYTPWLYPLSLPFPDPPYAAGFNPYPGTEFTSTVRGHYTADFNSIQGNTVHGSQGPALSFQNIGTQQYLEPPPFEYTVPRGKSSADDSGYQSWVPNETDTSFNPAPAAAASHRAASEHNPHLLSNMLLSAAGCPNPDPYSEDLVDDDLLPGSRGRGC